MAYTSLDIMRVTCDAILCRVKKSIHQEEKLVATKILCPCDSTNLNSQIIPKGLDWINCMDAYNVYILGMNDI